MNFNIKRLMPVFFMLMVVLVVMPQTFAVDDNSTNFEDIKSDSNMEFDDIRTADGDSVIYVSPSGNDDNVGDEANPLATIQKALNLSSTSGTSQIYVSEGVYTEHNLEITHSVSIIGNGNVIIDAANSGRIFKITGDNTVTLANLELINGLAPADIFDYSWYEYNAFGGAIYVQSSSIILDNMTFRDNAARGSYSLTNGSGGAIYLDGGEAQISNSNFTTNSATRYGGAIDSEGALISIINSTFIANSARDGGAVVVVNTGSVNNTIRNSTFNNNRATTSGGGIFIQNSYGSNYLKIDGNRFNYNWATNGASVANDRGNAEVINNYMSNGTASYGGAIYNSGVIILENNTQADTASTYGAIYNNGGTLYSNLVITFMDGNTVISDDGLNVILNVTVVDDMGNPISGGSVVFTINGQEAVQTPSSLINGFATLDYTPIQNGNLVVSGNYRNSNLEDNTIINGYLSVSNAVEVYTGPIYVSKDGDDANEGRSDEPVLTLDRAIELATGTYGSGILIMNEGTYEVSQYYTFTQSITIIGQGEVILDGEDSSSIFFFSPTSAGVNFNITGLTFANAYSEYYSDSRGYGSAITLRGGNLYLEDCKFVNNSASEYAGAIFVNNGYDYSTYDNIPGYAVILNSYFANNSAARDGGAIVNYNGNVTIRGSTFINNTANNGGAVSLQYGNGVFNIDNSTFINNVAAIEAGALDVNANPSSYSPTHYVSVTNSKFINNSAQTAGAITMGYGVLDNCIFINNSATGNGGAVYTENDVNVTNNRFYNNTAGVGGSIAIMGSPYFDPSWGDVPYEILLKNNTVEDSSATTNANEIYIGPNVYVNGIVITILNNSTITLCEGSNVTINALITDDNGNRITASGFNFVINGINYSSIISEGLASMYYVLNLTDNGVVVSATLEVAGDDLIVNTATFNVVPYGIIIEVGDIEGFTGQNVQITVNVTDNAGIPIYEGNATVSFNGESIEVPVRNGYAIVTIELPQNAGNYDLAISYGNTTLNKAVTVNSRNTNIIADNIDSYFGAENIFHAILIDNEGNPIANAILNITVGNRNYALVSDGNGSVYLKLNLTVGNYTAIINFEGDSNYNPAIVTSQISIKSTLAGNDIVKYYLNDTQYYVTVLDTDGTPLANTQVSIEINGVVYNRTTNASGVIRFFINLNPGSYSIKVTNPASNETIENEIIVLPTITGEDIVKYFRNDTQYDVKVLDAQGRPVVSQDVTININGVFYNRTTNSEGIARLNINLNPGTYIVTAYNLENGEAVSNTVVVLPTITENMELVKYYRNSSQYSVKIVDGEGNPVIGRNVTFNINGMIYQRLTNESGYAGLNINLNPGSYIITAEYGGLRVSNNITVLPTITATDLVKNFGEDDTYDIAVVDGQGRPVVNQNVTININGVFYDRTTDENGIARLNINLLPGEYIATAYYGTAAISNRVTVIG